MDFQRAKRNDVNTLIEKYNRIKRRTGWDLTTRENNVKHLLKIQETNGDAMSKIILAEYLMQEIVPLLEHFEGDDRETIRQYFRFISKAKTIYPGFVIGR